MTDKKNSSSESEPDKNEEPIVRDKRRVDPETGDVREPADASGPSTSSGTEGSGPSTPSTGSGTEASGTEGSGAEGSAADSADDSGLSEADQALLDQASTDLVAEMRSDMLRAQAELVNFRTRVERDRTANREAVIAEVIRSMLPALDDLARAEAHGDLVEGAPLTIVAQKLRSAFERYGLKQIGVKGEPFDPAFHEAVVQLPSPEATANTIADVIEPGYVLGDRLVRAAKVAVSVPSE